MPPTDKNCFVLSLTKHSPDRKEGVARTQTMNCASLILKYKEGYFRQYRRNRKNIMKTRRQRKLERFCSFLKLTYLLLQVTNIQVFR